MAGRQKVETILEIRSQLDGKALQEFDRLCKSAGVEAGKMGKEVKAATEQTQQGAERSAVSMMKFYGAITGAALALKSFYNHAKEQHQAQVMLNNAWENTGRSLGVTKKELSSLTDELQTYSGETKATIYKTQAFLLGIQGMSKDHLPAAQKAVADLAAKMGMDMPSAARIFAKAMEKPSDGLMNLRRYNILFSDSTEASIKKLEAAGKTYEAQALMLDEIKKRVGGLAEELNNSPYGNVETGMNMMKDAAAHLFGMLSPVVDLIGRFITFIAGLVKSLSGVPLVLGAVAVAILHFSSAVTFSMGPIGWTITGLVALAGAFGILGGSARAAREDLQNTRDAIKGFREDQYKNTAFAAQVSALDKLKEGTQEYMDEVKKILTLNPQLAKSNAFVGKSYQEIGKQLRDMVLKNDAYAKASAKRIWEDTYSQVVAFRNLLNSRSIKDLKPAEQMDFFKQLAQAEAMSAYYNLPNTTSLSAITGLMNEAQAGSGIQGYAAQLNRVFAETYAKYMAVLQGFVKDTGAAPKVQDFSKMMQKKDGDGDKKAYDLAPLLRERALLDAEPVNRELIKLQLDYAAKQKEIREGIFKDEKDRALALSLLQGEYLAKWDQEQRKIQTGLKKTADQQRKEEEQRKKDAAEKQWNTQKTMIDDVTGYWSLAMQAVNGDVATASLGVINKVAQQTKNAALGWFGFAATMIKDVMSIFATSSQSALDRLDERITKIKAALDLTGARSSIAAGLFGEASLETIDAKIADAVAAGSGRLGTLGMTGASQADLYGLTGVVEANKGQLAAMDKAYQRRLLDLLRGKAGEGLTEAEKKQRAEQIMAAYAAEASALLGTDAGSAYMSQLATGGFKVQGNTFGSGWTVNPAAAGGIQSDNYLTTWLDQLTQAAEGLVSEESLKMQKELLGYEKQLADLSHDVATGTKTDLAANEERLEIYDAQIAALTAYMEIAESDYAVQAAINKLEEERYATEQAILNAKKTESGIDAALLQGARGRQLQALLAQEAEIKAAIASGRIDQSTGNALLADVQRSIARELTLAGAGSELVGKYESSAGGLVSGLVGNAAYQSAAAAGLAYNMSIIPRPSSLGSSGGVVNNTGGNTYILNGGSVSPGDQGARQLVAQIASEFGLRVLEY